MERLILLLALWLPAQQPEPLYKPLLAGEQVAQARAAAPTLPATVSGDAGTFIPVVAQTEQEEVRWYSPDAGLSVFPPELLTNKKATVVVANKAGRYRLICWTATLQNAKAYPTVHASTVIVIGTPPPEPDPKPPVPPDPPDPPTPEPTDDFYKGLKAAWNKESIADKRFRDDYAALFRQMAGVVQNDKSLTTVIQFAQKQLEARRRLIGEALPETRGIIGAYLNSQLPHNLNTPLTDEVRGQYRTAYLKISDYLSRMNK